jgi:hypothetical protein
MRETKMGLNKVNAIYEHESVVPQRREKIARRKMRSEQLKEKTKEEVVHAKTPDPKEEW